jgi:hypothetical protein
VAKSAPKRRGKCFLLSGCRSSAYAFGKRFPEFWNTLVRRDIALRPQPLAAGQWRASRAPGGEGQKRSPCRDPSAAVQASYPSRVRRGSQLSRAKGGAQIEPMSLKVDFPCLSSREPFNAARGSRDACSAGVLSLQEPHPAKQILATRVGPQGVKPWIHFQKSQSGALLLIGLLQAHERTFSVT